MVDRLQGLSKYNIAWITKNKPESGDTEASNQHTRAAGLFQKWLQEGALVQDGKESFYAFLAGLRGTIFRDEDFAHLYAQDNGRPSVPPSLLATALLLQTYDRV